MATNYLSKISNRFFKPAYLKSSGLAENEKPEYIIELALSAIIATITLWFKNQKNIPSKELIGLIASMSQNGISPYIPKPTASSGQ